MFSTNKSHLFAFMLLSRSRNSEFTISFTCSILFFISWCEFASCHGSVLTIFFSTLPAKILFTLQLLNKESQIQAAAQKGHPERVPDSFSSLFSFLSPAFDCLSCTVEREIVWKVG